MSKLLKLNDVQQPFVQPSERIKDCQHGNLGNTTQLLIHDRVKVHCQHCQRLSKNA